MKVENIESLDISEKNENKNTNSIIQHSQISNERVELNDEIDENNIKVDNNNISKTDINSENKSSRIKNEIKEKESDYFIYSTKYNFIYDSTHLDCNLCNWSTGFQNLTKKFIKLSYDDETEEFMKYCHNKSYLKSWVVSMLKSFITKFYSLQDANGMLGSGKMFIVSQSHLKILLEGETFKNMIDIGAGDGLVTEKFKFLIENKEEIYCTETSEKLKLTLKNKGFKVIDSIDGQFDLVVLLNVLDRCEKPISLLESIKKLKFKYFLTSIVLPFSGFYTENTKKYPQKEYFIDKYKNWEESVNIIHKKMESLGFEVIKLSRLPYLSEGNHNKSLFFLDTVILVMKLKIENEK